MGPGGAASTGLTASRRESPLAPPPQAAARPHPAPPPPLPPRLRLPGAPRLPVGMPSSLEPLPKPFTTSPRQKYGRCLMAPGESRPQLPSRRRPGPLPPARRAGRQLAPGATNGRGGTGRRRPALAARSRRQALGKRPPALGKWTRLAATSVRRARSLPRSGVSAGGGACSPRLRPGPAQPSPSLPRPVCPLGPGPSSPHCAAAPSWPRPFPVPPCGCSARAPALPLPSAPLGRGPAGGGRPSLGWRCRGPRCASGRVVGEAPCRVPPAPGRRSLRLRALPKAAVGEAGDGVIPGCVYSRQQWIVPRL